MIEKLGTKLGEYFFTKGYIKEEDIDAVRYYIEVFYNEYLQLIITLLIGYLINQLETTIIYLFCFVAIRKYSGGYHAKTILICNLISYFLYFSGLALNKLLSINFLIPLLLISFLYLWIRGAIYSVDQFEYKFQDKQTNGLKIILIILLVLIALYKKSQYLGLLTLVMLQVVLMNIVKERGMNHENC